MQNAPRVAARAAAVLAPCVLVLASAGRAAAEPPASWENTTSFSGMDVLLIYVGIPALLFVVLAVFGLLTHTSKATSYPLRREQDGGVALDSAATAEERALPESDDRSASGA